MSHKVNPEKRLKKQEKWIGQKFNRLTINRIYIGDDNIIHAECSCDCGNLHDAILTAIRSGNTKSCGCLYKEIAGKQRISHGQSNTRLYRVWAAMRKRCNNPKDSYYEDYGGRGIKVCDEWNNSFISFKEWADKNGFMENSTYQECSIDRIDHDGNYEPSNCRWVNMTTQANNKRNNHFIEYNGETHTIAEWGRITGVDQDVIFARIQYGITGADLFKKGRLKRRAFRKEDIT